jgi:hypothetical protein
VRDLEIKKKSIFRISKNAKDFINLHGGDIIDNRNKSSTQDFFKVTDKTIHFIKLKKVLHLAYKLTRQYADYHRYNKLNPFL